MRILRYSGSAVAIALTACAGSIATGMVPSANQPRPVIAIRPGAASAVTGNPAGTGGIVMHINWPARSGYQAQTIPLASQLLNVYAVASGSVTPAASVSIAYPTPSATLSALASGSYTVTAQAYQNPGALNYSTLTLVASGSQLVAVAANQQSSATINMADQVPPHITSVTTNLGTDVFWSPAGTLPSNLELLIKGYGLLGYGVATPSVTVDGTASTIVTSSYGSGTGQDLVQVGIPASWNGTGQVVLTVDGLSSNLAPGLVIVSTASVTPDPATAVSHTPLGNTESFTASATSSAGASVPAADLNWSLNITGSGADPSQMAQCGMYVGSFASPVTAGTALVTSATGVGNVTYYASSSVPIPDSSPCTVNGGSVTFSSAKVDLYLLIGGSTAVTLPVTIN